MRLPPTISLVVGIPRSGILPASIIALARNLPVISLGEYLSDAPIETGITRQASVTGSTAWQYSDVLLIDDSVNSGDAMRLALAKIREKGLPQPHTAAIYGTNCGIGLIDFVVRKVSQPRVFEWNFLHHWIMEHSCLDIDGVLCRDPALLQKWGWGYRNHVAEAPVYLQPSRKVNTIVSSRLDKYRPETLEWLERSGIEFERLVLMSEESAASRKLLGLHPYFKAEVYSASPCLLFVESDDRQAKIIAETAKKPVYCPASSLLHTPKGLLTGANPSFKTREFLVVVRRYLALRRARRWNIR